MTVKKLEEIVQMHKGSNDEHIQVNLTGSSKKIFRRFMQQY